ncbi:MAG: hypothetical protein ACKVUT_09645 [Gaiella sp.]
MSGIEPLQVNPLFRWRPWPPGDPAPEIWRIIDELDQRVQLQVVGAILQTQIASAKVHAEGLQKIHDVIAKTR